MDKTEEAGGPKITGMSAKILVLLNLFLVLVHDEFSCCFASVVPSEYFSWVLRSSLLSVANLAVKNLAIVSTSRKIHLGILGFPWYKVANVFCYLLKLYGPKIMADNDKISYRHTPHSSQVSCPIGHDVRVTRRYVEPLSTFSKARRNSFYNSALESRWSRHLHVILSWHGAIRFFSIAKNLHCSASVCLGRKVFGLATQYWSYSRKNFRKEFDPRQSPKLETAKENEDCLFGPLGSDFHFPWRIMFPFRHCFCFWYLCSITLVLWNSTTRSIQSLQACPSWTVFLSDTSPTPYRSSTLMKIFFSYSFSISSVGDV